MELKCAYCFRQFHVPPSHAKRRKYCQRSCKALAMKGKPFFDSTGLPSWNKGLKGVNTAWNKGKKGVYSEETLGKMRNAAIQRTPEEHSCWKGGSRIHNGYRMIFSPDHPGKNANNCVYEHRLVMEKHIGRFLNQGEVVHHKNLDKLDNRIDNLQLFSNHKAHMDFHAKCIGIKGRPKKPISQ